MKKKRNKKEGRLILGLLILAFLIVVARLFWLYVSEGIINTNYRDPEITGEYYRGTIYDRNNEILAMDSVEYIIKVNTRSLTGISRASSVIAGHSGLSAIEIEELLANGAGTVDIPSTLSASGVDDFLELLEKERLERSIHVEKTLVRAYPTNEHGKEIIGRVDAAMTGISGAELLFNDVLSPPLVLGDGVIRGADIRLSIDISMQYICDFVLSSYAGNDDGMIAVINKNDGQLYALSSTGYEKNEIDGIMASRISPSFVPGLLADEKVDAGGLEGPYGLLRMDGTESCVTDAGSYLILTASGAAGTSRPMAEETLDVMVHRGKMRPVT